jgi:hypothetical protein
MQLFKIIFSFIALGGAGAGATYAIIRLNKAPIWLMIVSLMLGSATLIYALLELPHVVDAVDLAYDKGEGFFRRHFQPSISSKLEPPLPAATASPIAEPPDNIPSGQPLPTPQITQAPSLFPSGQQSALPDTPDTQTEAVHLAVHEGAAFQLILGKTYILDAPLGYTVGYRSDEGTVSLYRDGRELRIACTSSFKTFARRSKY